MITAILQARMLSTRLPGKVLMDLVGKPMLARQIERVQRSKRLNGLIVATSVDKSDDQIAALCHSMGVSCYRGSLEDVLDRYYQAALTVQPEHVVRVTGDCPLIDPDVIDQTIDLHLQGKFDYTANNLEPTYPDGLDTEICRFSALESAWKLSTTPTDREHVTNYICSHPESFRIGSLTQPINRSSWRWTVDEPQDFKLVERIYQSLFHDNAAFSSDDIVNFLSDKPDLLALNTYISRDEGFAKSMKNDQIAKFKAHTIQKSLDLQFHAKSRIPGLSQLLSKRPDKFSFGVWPGYYSRAKGAEVWDLDGNRYLDMSIAGIGANVLGYADPDVDAAVIEAIKNGSSSSLNCPEEVELADVFCELHPWANKARFARTGGEAMTVAVRIARAYTGRDKIAFCGYHGWHDWYLSANLGSDDALDGHLLKGLSPKGVPRALAGTALPFKYNHLEELAEIFKNHSGQVAAIVMEPIRNFEPEPGFLEGVRTLASKHGSVLVIDEISSAFRVNAGGAHLNYGLKPDIAVFSKAIGNGYPIAAIIGNSVMEAAQSTFISSTNWSERVGPTAALATIRKFCELKVHETLVKLGSTVQVGWKVLAQKHDLPIEVGGMTPMSHFSFECERPLELSALFVQLMLDRGFLASGDYYAMYAHTLEHVETYLEAVDGVFAEIQEIRQSGKITETLRGNPVMPGFTRLN